MNQKLSPQMEKLLGLLEPGRVESVPSIEERFYGQRKGTFGYVNAGRGHGSGSLLSTFRALERRGLVERVEFGWVRR